MDWLNFDTNSLASGAIDGLVIAIMFNAIYFVLLGVLLIRSRRQSGPSIPLAGAAGWMTIGSVACIGWSAVGLWPIGVLTLVAIGFMSFKKISAISGESNESQSMHYSQATEAKETISGYLPGTIAPDNSNIEKTIVEAKRRYWYNRVNIFVLIGSLLAVAIVIGYLTRFVDTVVVVVAPDDAAKTATVKVTHGTALSVGSTIWVLNRQLTIEVESPGFSGQTVAASDASFERGVIDIILQELPASLNASTTPSVDGTKWYLDDVLVSADSVFHTDLAPGTYKLSAIHPDFLSASTEIIAERGESYVVNLEFETFEVQVTITSNPSGAKIELDSKVLGHTPLTTLLAGGSYSLDLSAENYQSISDTLQITQADLQIGRYYELKHAAVALEVSLKPQGGQFVLNSQVISPSAIGTIRLPLGSTHTASYSKPGFITKQLQFTINSTSSKNIAFDLEPEYGKVTVQSIPSANVVVNGTDMGRTPLDLNLQTVSQNITLSENGYITQTRTLTPDPSKRTLVSVELASEKQHRIANAKGKYQNSIGMEMILFDKSDTFVMGSPRGERHRRVNEFERTVQLSRPFYAGSHEVTVDQFMLASNPNHQSGGGSQIPATGMSWADAAKFCNWLSDKEGLQPVYEFYGDFLVRSYAQADGYRLLTEAEWEWLARKANRSKTSIFPWGNKAVVPSNVGNLADESAQGSVDLYIPKYRDGQPRLAKTGLFPAEKSGLHDLVGNVKEWTHDPYTLTAPNSDATQVNPFDESGQSRSHVIKGSSWRSADVRELRAAWRDGNSSSADDIGFRIARYLYKE